MRLSLNAPFKSLSPTTRSPKLKNYLFRSSFMKFKQNRDQKQLKQLFLAKKVEKDPEPMDDSIDNIKRRSRMFHVVEADDLDT
jgi:hypothetical protein